LPENFSPRLPFRFHKARVSLAQNFHSFIFIGQQETIGVFRGKWKGMGWVGLGKLWKLPRHFPLRLRQSTALKLIARQQGPADSDPFLGENRDKILMQMYLQKSVQI